MDRRDSPPIVIHQAVSERAEAEFVVHNIEQLLGGTSLFSLDSGRVSGDGDELSFDDFAVLYRTAAAEGAAAEGAAAEGATQVELS